MMAVEYGDDLVLIDSGGKFPEEWERGIDLIIPDVRYVKNRLAKLRGIPLPTAMRTTSGRCPTSSRSSPIGARFRSMGHH